MSRLGHQARAMPVEEFAIKKGAADDGNKAHISASLPFVYHMILDKYCVNCRDVPFPPFSVSIRF